LDPANAYVSEESHTYTRRIAAPRNTGPIWCALGEGGVDWKGQFRALAEDGYKSWISLETHRAGPRGDELEAIAICGRNLKALVAKVERTRE
jgi:sugar phosphate isomerase/epimerase